MDTPTDPYIPPLPGAYPERVQSPHPRLNPVPFLAGFLLVVTLAAGIGVGYYKLKFTPAPPTHPSPSPIFSPSPESSPTPSTSASASATPKVSVKPSPSPISALRPTPKPTATPSPTPTPITLDIRFGNPSGHVKQTIDEGHGSGRVINREYSSIQAGQFDEVSTSWSPKVTTCFHLVAEEPIEGAKIKYKLTVDDKTEVEDTMGWLGTLESGKIYDWCRDVTTGIGKHTAKLILNPDNSLKERNYNNNTARIDWENLADNIAPNFTIDGPYSINGETCMRWINLEDNVSVYTDVWGKWKIDGGAWSDKTSENPYGCISGTSGSSHTYYVHAEDYRGNINEQSKNFVLY